MGNAVRSIGYRVLHPSVELAPSSRNVGNPDSHLTISTVYRDLAMGVPPADSARCRQSEVAAGFMTAPTTGLVLLFSNFGYTACGLVILNFSRDSRLQYLSRFEQIFHCGRVTSTCASREVDPTRWEAVQI
jgi:hypothetical protein